MDIIEQIEKKYPVTEITIDGEQVWPLLRIFYAFSYRRKLAENSGENVKKDPGLKKFRSARFLLHLILLFKGVSVGFFNWFRKYEFIAFGNGIVRRQISGRRVDPFLDPVIKEIGSDKVLFIELPEQISFFSSRQSFTKHIVYVNLLRIIAGMHYRLKLIFCKKPKINRNDILDNIGLYLGVNVNPIGIILSHQSKLFVYNLLFKLMRPKAILLIDYYSPEWISAVKAANNLGIKVIEVQHGLIGKEHPAYNLGCKLDKSYFPDHLLVFGNKELETFSNSYFIKINNVHPVGSFLINYYRTEYKSDPGLLEQYSVYHVVIGITLQWVFDNRLINFICKAAELDDHILYILIPRRPEDDKYSARVLPDNVKIERIKNFYELMSYVDFHSTVNSTCALEAPALGVQNILVNIDKQAEIVYGKILSDERINRFVNSPEECVNTIRTFPKLDRESICGLSEYSFAQHYTDNIHNFVTEYLS